LGGAYDGFKKSANPGKWSVSFPLLCAEPFTVSPSLDSASQNAFGKAMKTFSRLLIDAFSMAVEIEDGSGGEKPTLPRFKHPSGTAHTTSSNPNILSWPVSCT
jgi:hypothetical protein